MLKSSLWIPLWSHETHSHVFIILPHTLSIHNQLSEGLISFSSACRSKPSHSNLRGLASKSQIKPYLERQRHNTAVKSGTETFLFFFNGNWVWAVPKQQPLCLPHVTEGNGGGSEKKNIVFPASHRCPAPPDETPALTSAFHPVVKMAVAWFFCLPRWIQSAGDPVHPRQITIFPQVPPDPSAITAPPTVCNYRCYYAVAAPSQPWGGNLNRILCLSCWFLVPLLILSSKSRRLKLPMWHNQRPLMLLNTVVCFPASSMPKELTKSQGNTAGKKKNSAFSGQSVSINLVQSNWLFSLSSFCLAFRSFFIFSRPAWVL